MLKAGEGGQGEGGQESEIRRIVWLVGVDEDQIEGATPLGRKLRERIERSLAAECGEGVEGVPAARGTRGA